MDLLEFLRAAIDTDERLALAALEFEEGEWSTNWTVDDLAEFAATNEGSLSVLLFIQSISPGRALREVAAKRAILASHDPVGTPCDTCSNDWVVVRWPCPTVRAIAAIFEGRPGWREEWTA